MRDNNLVIDSVAHAYAFQPENRQPACPVEAYEGLIGFLHGHMHIALESQEPGYLLSYDEFRAGWSAEDLASLFFEESDVDVIAYHGVEIAGLFVNGSSPWDIGVELKRQYPDRVLLYAPVDPFKGPSELDAMQEKAESCPIDGFKYYPSNGLLDVEHNRAYAMFYDDPERAFPFFEKARELGVMTAAFHKAVPVGVGPLDKDRVDDVSGAAVAFPDMNFEVVHSGWAFLEECALQLMLHPNIWANLECVANFTVRQPRRFAEIIGTLTMYAGADRIMFGTGAALAHPQPIVEAFADFEMPQELQEGLGYPEITPEMKAGMLGGNALRLHGLDPEEVKTRIDDDAWARKRADFIERGGAPWRQHRETIARTGAGT